MRCYHCGANLRHGVSLCEYCRSHNDIDLSGRHYYTTHLSEKKRICPECKKPMQILDVGLPEKPFYIDRCEKCLGLFFDTGELDTLLNESVQGIHTLNHVRISELKNAAPINREEIRYRPCPECKKLMNRQNYGGTSGVIADRCRDHGVFLDAGELYRLFHWRRAGGHLQELPKEKERKKEYEPTGYEFKEQKESGVFVSLIDLLADFVIGFLKR